MPHRIPTRSSIKSAFEQVRENDAAFILALVVLVFVVLMVFF